MVAERYYEKTREKSRGLEEEERKERKGSKGVKEKVTVDKSKTRRMRREK